MNDILKKAPPALSPEGADLASASIEAPRRLLVHMCCGPCSIVPLKSVLSGTSEVWGYFYNPNIHPKSEFRLRLEAVKKLASLLSLDVLYNEEYDPREFILGLKAAGGGLDVKHPEHGQRCGFCYTDRMEATAKAAAKNGFDAFSSSLLYSRYQAHDEIKALGLELADRYGVSFYYEDYRAGWQEGIEASKDMGLYRQKYCGCVYSKIERYAKKKAKAK